MDYNKIASFIILVTLAVSCGVCRKQPKVIYKDSTITKIEYRDRIVHDTAKVEIPVEVEKIVTKDTVSHLENTYAKSDAMVSNGLLYHSLESKPKVIKVPFEVVVHDTLKVSDTVKSETVTVEVPSPLSPFQRFRLNGFWFLLAALVLSLVWIFRKPLLSLIKPL